MAMQSKLKGLPLLVLALVIAALAVGCGSSSSSSSSSSGGQNLTGDGQPNIDLAGSREAKSEIDSGNVSQLQEAWSIPIEGQGTYGSYASTPVIVNGVVYSQDLESNASAIDLESGDVIWETRLESPSHGPNGLAVAEGRVYGATNGGAFALDQKTG
jgi:outer membrane protein assembly factor BamB